MSVDPYSKAPQDAQQHAFATPSSSASGDEPVEKVGALRALFDRAIGK